MGAMGSTLVGSHRSLDRVLCGLAPGAKGGPELVVPLWVPWEPTPRVTPWGRYTLERRRGGVWWYIPPVP